MYMSSGHYMSAEILSIYSVNNWFNFLNALKALKLSWHSLQSLRHDFYFFRQRPTKNLTDCIEYFS